MTLSPTPLRPAARAVACALAALVPVVPAAGARPAGPAAVHRTAAHRTAADPRIPTTVTVHEPEEERRYGTGFASWACVTSASGTPAGQVALYLDGTRWGSSVLSATGCASLYGPDQDRGSHSLVIKYTGSATHAPSAAGLRITVGKGSAHPRVAVDPPASRRGTPVTVTASFSDPPRAPSGKITVLEDGRALGSADLGPAGTASVVLRNLSVGAHPLSVEYTGDYWFEHSGSEQVTAWVFAGDTSPVLIDLSGPMDLPLPSGLNARIDLHTIPPMDGVVGVRLVDTRGGDVVGYSAGTQAHQWTLVRADAVYDLQAQAVDAAGTVLHRSPTLRVSWEPPDTTLTASSTSPAAGQDVTLSMAGDLGAGLESHFVLRILELTGDGPDDGVLVAECEPGDGCRATVERPAGAHRFVGLFLARDSELTIRRGAPVTVTWS